MSEPFSHRTVCRPVVFVIKNVDVFEATLVMSTLSPEEESVLLQQNQQLDQTQRSANLPNINHTQSILVDAEPPSIATDTDCTTSDISVQRKRNRVVSQAAPKAKMNANAHVTNDDGCDILRKKRKTTEPRESDKLPTPAPNQRTNENAAPPECDLSSENINVVFQDESHVPGMLANDEDDALLAVAVNDVQMNEPRSRPRQRQGRDHRPIVRHVFNRCFTGSSQSSENLGAVLLDCSDEES